jgi:YidC/Oxa1 family membrane protein insertase
MIWSTFLELFQAGLFGLTQLYGGHLGPAIVSFALLARVVLLPVTVPMTLRARAHGRRLKAMQPELARLRNRWKDDPRRLMTETMRAYDRRGIRPMDPALLKGSLLQAPIFIGLFQAIRTALSTRGIGQTFLWVSNLARPDVGIAAVAFAFIGMSSLAGATDPQPKWMLALPAVSSAAMAMALSAGFGLYLAATGAVGTLQGLLVRRLEAQERAA